MYDLVSLGEILIDFTINGQDENGYNCYLENPGGAPLNVSCVFSKYNGKSAFIGKVGDDIFGHYLINYIEKLGVDTSGISLDKKHLTTLSFVSLDSNGDRDFAFYRKNSADINLSKKDIKEDLIKDSRIFHFGSLSMTNKSSYLATLYALEIAKRENIKISFDPNYRENIWEKDKAKEKIMEVIENANYLKVSLNEAQLITGKKDLKECAKELIKYVKEIVLITLGENGVYYITKSDQGLVSSYHNNVVDTTGAGDIFFGTFLFELMQNNFALEKDKLINCIKKGCKAASLSIGKKGAIPSIPNYEDIII